MNDFISIPKDKKYDGMFMISLEERRNCLKNSVNIDGVFIYYSNTTNLIIVEDQDCNNIGVMLGVVIDYTNNNVIKEKLTLTIDRANYIDSIESQVYKYCGSWIFILSNDNYKRMYLDSCGSYSSVYDPLNKTASSTVGQLLNDKEFIERFDDELYADLGVSNIGWIPVGLTAHYGIKRLICNHYLNLETCESVRHWPKDKFNQNDNVREVSHNIADIIQSTVKALSDDGKTCLTITGGKDSRLILSSIKKFKDKVELATINLPGSELDVYLAKEITSLDDDLKYTIYPPVKATNQRRLQWLYNASYCVGGVNQYYSPSIGPLSKYKYLVGGAAGEIGRAFLWRETDTKYMQVNSSMLISRLGLKYNKKIKQEIDQWLQELTEYDAYTTLDLAYTELRVSPWAFAQSYSYEGRGILTQVSPFVNREIISLLFSLPGKARREESYVYEGISYLWPELLNIKFNKYGDFRDYIEIVKKIFTPGMLLGKLRKVFLGG